MENRGRHGNPWNGRNLCLGIEEVRGYSALGLRESAKPNPVSKQGIPTVAALSAKKQTVVNYIQGVVRIPKGFDGVKNVKFGERSAEFISRSGKAVSAPVDPSFVFTGCLE